MIAPGKAQQIDQISILKLKFDGNPLLSVDKIISNETGNLKCISIVKLNHLNSFMHNVVKWPNIL